MSKKIILASASPRRKELLAMAGVSFHIQIPDVDETPFKNESPDKMVKRLSYLKAIEVSRSMSKSKIPQIILAADTTVVGAKNKILGKPKDKKEALQMIDELQGKSHFVFTGYTLLLFSSGKVIRKISRTIKTKVFIRKLSSLEVRQYVSRGESMDKAGAYAAQGFGMALVEKIEGSYTNVVGLPVSEVLKDLNQLGWKS